MEKCREFLDQIFIIDGYELVGDEFVEKQIEIDDCKFFDNNEDNTTMTFMQYVGELKNGRKYDIKYTTRLESLVTGNFLDYRPEYIEKDLTLQIKNFYTSADNLVFNTYVFKKVKAEKTYVFENMKVKDSDMESFVDQLKKKI